MSINCRHWGDVGGDGFGTCAQFAFGGRPRHTDCLTRCSLYNSVDADLAHVMASPPELLGDMVESLAEKWGLDKVATAWERATGLPCGCEGRKQLLNRVDGFVRKLFR